jgi:hypothetical protein
MCDLEFTASSLLVCFDLVNGLELVLSLSCDSVRSIVSWSVYVVAAFACMLSGGSLLQGQADLGLPVAENVIAE